MGYFVEHPGGQRFGPADVQTLSQWAIEGRLIPSTVIIDEATGSRFFAQDVPGISFPGNSVPTIMPGPGMGAGTPLGTHSSQPIYTPYGASQTPLYRPPSGVSSAFTASYMASGFGMVMACCIPQIAVLAGIVGMILAFSVRKVDLRRANWAIALGAGTAILGLSGSVLMEILGRALRGG